MAAAPPCAVTIYRTVRGFELQVPVRFCGCADSHDAGGLSEMPQQVFVQDTGVLHHLGARLLCVRTVPDAGKQGHDGAEDDRQDRQRTTSSTTIVPTVTRPVGPDRLYRRLFRYLTSIRNLMARSLSFRHGKTCSLRWCPVLIR